MSSLEAAAPEDLAKVREAAELKGGVYGQVMVTATVAALALDDSLSATSILIFTVATMFVFWLAHVYAELVSAHVVAGSQLSRDRMLTVFRSEWPIMQSAGPPSLALALAALGLYSTETGIRIALITGVVLLAGWGWLIGSRAGLSKLGTFVAASLSAALGLLVIILELALH